MELKQLINNIEQWAEDRMIDGVFVKEGYL